MSMLIGRWSGSFSYPNDSEKEITFTIEKSANGSLFIGTGHEPSGEFDIIAGQVIESEGQDIVTFAQIYKSIWEGQIWSFRGVVGGNGGFITGQWFDSPADGRNRIGSWNVQRIE
ncbi:predicted protein [Chaetomium globosum CBS 148.51]|uniref:Uncharacterized protein n=1 Tax=Chaetomium globosum (strain ATCC 6205 / CBS 148.51 / DSM 1962 / NBRC 6347 / NRRL 1970) TaxID=306901 RepID=Q2HCM4_CHAGB|nr:uncharacterized protein CHGG_02030 [Chaetomium globosum CBS 148.51]EAQ93795.1 predicted protein [Chaetomium globosum CBS 148.51]